MPFAASRRRSIRRRLRRTVTRSVPDIFARDLRAFVTAELLNGCERCVCAARYGLRANGCVGCFESHSPLQGGTLANYVLRLFVTGTSPRAEMAVNNLRRICEQELRGQYELQVIDVLEQPELAEEEKILATPTLIKQLPPPLRRVIGDLSDKDKVLFGLEVRPIVLTDSDPKHDKR
jgi:circadian clock protein KaiB